MPIPGIPVFGNNPLGTDLDANGHRIIDVGNPIDSQDVATKSYIDSIIITESQVNGLSTSLASKLDLSSLPLPVASGGTGTTNGTINYSGTVTAVIGASGGDLYWSMPGQGTSYKKVVIVCSNITNDPIVIAFPIAFIHSPSVVGNGTGLTIVALSASSITVPSTSSTSGVIIVEGI